MEDKITALARFVGCEIEDVKDEKDYFTADGHEYVVFTDEEADEACADYIRESVWAFRPTFIAHNSKHGWSQDLEDSIAAIQAKQCESANAAIEAIIADMDSFIEDAIRADGRGHFLSSYDGEENEEGDFFIYRI